MYTGRSIFAQVMDFMPAPIFRRCMGKYQGDFGVKNFSCLDRFLEDLNETVYALDSTTIDLCLSMSPWADFRKTKAAIKLHDVNTLDYLQLESGAYYVMDRGYLDFSRLYSFTKTAAFFVTRSKSNTKFRRLYSHPVDRSTGLICDQTIVLTGTAAPQNYPEKMRRVKFNQRPGYRRNSGFSNEQLYLASINNRPFVSAVAGRWNCFSNGSSNTSESRSFSERQRTR